MRETAVDLEWLQQVLDRSYDRGGEHLRSILTPATRLDADQLAETLVGVQVLALATVTRDGAPRVAPVDGIFHRGRFHFGTAPGSVRARHLRERPAVSATHTRGEDLVVIVHGTVEPIDPLQHDGGSFAETSREVYGAQWDDWTRGNPYWRIEPERMYAGDLRVLRQG